MVDIQPQHLTFDQLIYGRLFRIPQYQRTYSSLNDRWSVCRLALSVDSHHRLRRLPHLLSQLVWL
jgi:hypothetical protein